MRTGRVSAACSTRDFRYLVSGRRDPSNLGLVSGRKYSVPGAVMPIEQRAYDAPILSRMRSEVTSRSNWAKDNKTLSVRRLVNVQFEAHYGSNHRLECPLLALSVQSDSTRVCPLLE